MEKLIEYFITNMSVEKMWVAFLALAIYYILKKEPFKVFSHFSEKREREHELAKELLESEKLTKEANEFLREHLEHYAFKRYYGISADAEMRSALIKFQRKHQRDLSWPQIRRAYLNVQLKGTKITAKLDMLDHVFRWLVTVLCILISGYALVVIILVTLTNSEMERQQFFYLTIIALGLLCAAVLFSSLNWSYHNTRTVIKLSNSE